MRRIGITAGWTFLLALTFFLALVHSGCSKSQTPVAKPKEPASAAASYSCLMVEREGKSEAIFCGSKDMCSHVYNRLVAVWEPLATRYGATALSECLAVEATFTARD